jgi:transketolase
MRNRFVLELEKQAALNPKIILLVGDIGFGVFENYQKCFPDRFINMGIAEQNMISVAAGVAKEGYQPIVYTIIPFLTMRAFEQIRIDIAMHYRKILLVGVGGGYSYDILGPTHHALEDLAVIRTLPNFRILTPGSPNQISGMSKEIFDFSVPTYLRLGKNGENDFESNANYIELFGAYHLGSKSKNIVISHGPISSEVEIARLKLFANHGIQISHYSVVKNEPIPVFLFENIIQEATRIFFIEENYSSGSLFSEFCCFYSQRSSRLIEIHALHPPKKFYSRVAKRNEILIDIKMDNENILSLFMNTILI